MSLAKRERRVHARRPLFLMGGVQETPEKRKLRGMTSRLEDKCPGLLTANTQKMCDLPVGL